MFASGVVCLRGQRFILVLRLSVLSGYCGPSQEMQGARSPPFLCASALCKRGEAVKEGCAVRVGKAEREQRRNTCNAPRCIQVCCCSIDQGQGGTEGSFSHNTGAIHVRPNLLWLRCRSWNLHYRGGANRGHHTYTHRHTKKVSLMKKPTHTWIRQ